MCFNNELQRNLSLFYFSQITTNLNYDQALQEHLKMKNKFLHYSNLNSSRLDDARFTLNSIVSINTDLQKIGDMNDEIEILG